MNKNRHVAKFSNKLLALIAVVGMLASNGLAFAADYTEPTENRVPIEFPLNVWLLPLGDRLYTSQNVVELEYADETGETFRYEHKLYNAMGAVILEDYYFGKFSEGLAPAYNYERYRNGGFMEYAGFIDEDGVLVIDAQYSSVCGFSEELAFVWGGYAEEYYELYVIDKSGDIILDLTELAAKERIDKTEQLQFRGDLAALPGTNAGQHSTIVINKVGDIVAKHDGYLYYNNGYNNGYVVIANNTDYNPRFYDEQGKAIEGIIALSAFVEGYALVEQDETQFVVDTGFNRVFPQKGDETYRNRSQYTIVLNPYLISCGTWVIHNKNPDIDESELYDEYIYFNRDGDIIGKYLALKIGSVKDRGTYWLDYSTQNNSYHIIESEQGSIVVSPLGEVILKTEHRNLSQSDSDVKTNRELLFFMDSLLSNSMPRSNAMDLFGASVLSENYDMVDNSHSEGYLMCAEMSSDYRELLKVMLVPYDRLSEPSGWAKPYISNIKTRVFLPKYIMGDYLHEIRRDEFAALLYNTYESIVGVQIVDGVEFTDIDDSLYKTHIEKACAAGLLQGVGGARFEPDGILNREQLAVFICNLLNALEPFELPQVENTGFADNNSISTWAASQIAYCYENGILDGTGNSMYEPKLTLNRETALAGMEKLVYWVCGK